MFEYCVLQDVYCCCALLLCFALLCFALRFVVKCSLL